MPDAQSPPLPAGILCPACNKTVWPFQEMSLEGAMVDKCPTEGCGCVLTTAMTDEHREGHADKKRIREPEPTAAAPQTVPNATDIAAQVLAALKTSGLLPAPSAAQVVAPPPPPPKPKLSAAEALVLVIRARIDAIDAECATLHGILTELE